jgi:hypothetical protein
MIRDDRARITLPDLVYVLGSLAILGALGPVFYEGLAQNVGVLSTGEALLWQAMVPFAGAVLLSVIWFKAIKGAY